MRCSTGSAGLEQPIFDVFTSTFTASEGPAEGRSVGGLARDLLESTPGDDIVVCCAHSGQTLVGCIIFSRLRYDEDPRTVFLLSPVAVRTDRQGEGIGQRLLAYGLAELRAQGIDAVLTYGDPDYYARVGFERITEDVAQPPFALTQPHGWLGQALTAASLEPLTGPCRCVPALDRPEYW